MMGKAVKSIGLNTNIEDALKLLEKERIRHLPIVDDIFKHIRLKYNHSMLNATPSTFDYKNESYFFKRKKKISVTNIILTSFPFHPNKKVLAFLISLLDDENLVVTIKEAHFPILWPKDMEMTL